MSTVKDMEWNGIKNGLLLLLAKENNFDAWISSGSKLSCDVLPTAGLVRTDISLPNHAKAKYGRGRQISFEIMRQ
jgi:hypothetical protein